MTASETTVIIIQFSNKKINSLQSIIINTALNKKLLCLVKQPKYLNIGLRTESSQDCDEYFHCFSL